MQRFAILVLVTYFVSSSHYYVNSAEKDALVKLKVQIADRISGQWMNSDFYLIRWLRKTRLNIQKAKQLILQTIAWRQSNNIANITSEDWSDLETDFPISFKGQDKEGRPLLFLDYGEWNLRAAFVQGKIRRFQRYLAHATERSTQNIFKAQKDGRQVSRMIVIINADGVNLHQHGCAKCTSVFVQWSLDKETYYPNFTDETILINVIGLGSNMINAVRAVVGNEMKEQTIVFDHNRKKWMAYLDQRIDRDQRTTSYGGTKTE